MCQSIFKRHSTIWLAIKESSDKFTGRFGHIVIRWKHKFTFDDRLFGICFGIPEKGRFPVQEFIREDTKLPAVE